MREVVREALFVPDSMPAVQLLESFRNSHKHLALVMDEFGGLAADAAGAEVSGRILDMNSRQPLGDVLVRAAGGGPTAVSADDGTFRLTGLVGYTLSTTRRRYPDHPGFTDSFPPKYDRLHDLNVVLTQRLGRGWRLDGPGGEPLR